MTVGLTNAFLLEIRGAGAVDRSGDTTADGPVLWEGRAGGYLSRERGTTISGGRTVRVVLDTFTMLTSAGAPALEQAGPDWDATTIVVEDRRTIPALVKRFTVDEMRLAAAGTPVDSIRCELSGETMP